MLTLLLEQLSCGGAAETLVAGGVCTVDQLARQPEATLAALGVKKGTRLKIATWQNTNYPGLASVFAPTPESSTAGEEPGADWSNGVATSAALAPAAAALFGLPVAPEPELAPSLAALFRVPAVPEPAEVAPSDSELFQWSPESAVFLEEENEVEEVGEETGTLINESQPRKLRAAAAKEEDEEEEFMLQAAASAPRAALVKPPPAAQPSVEVNPLMLASGLSEQATQYLQSLSAAAAQAAPMSPTPSGTAGSCSNGSSGGGDRSESVASVSLEATNKQLILKPSGWKDKEWKLLTAEEQLVARTVPSLYSADVRKYEGMSIDKLKFECLTRALPVTEMPKLSLPGVLKARLILHARSSSMPPIAEGSGGGGAVAPATSVAGGGTAGGSSSAVGRTFNSMPEKELQAECARVGLPTAGTKDVLVARLTLSACAACGQRGHTGPQCPRPPPLRPRPPLLLSPALAAPPPGKKKTAGMQLDAAGFRAQPTASGASADSDAAFSWSVPGAGRLPIDDHAERICNYVATHRVRKSLLKKSLFKRLEL
jgi:hypothetical protein